MLIYIIIKTVKYFKESALVSVLCGAAWRFSLFIPNVAKNTIFRDPLGPTLSVCYWCCCLFVVSSGASWDAAGGSAIVMVTPFFCQLSLPPPSSRKFLKTRIVCLSPSQKPSLTHGGSTGTWRPGGGEGDRNLQHRIQDRTVQRLFIKGATERTRTCASLCSHVANQALYI